MGRDAFMGAQRHASAVDQRDFTDVRDAVAAYALLQGVKADSAYKN